jgi:hypothetical protein
MAGWLPKGPSDPAVLGDMLDGEMEWLLPEAVQPMFRRVLDLLGQLNAKNGELDKEIARHAREETVARRLRWYRAWVRSQPLRLQHSLHRPSRSSKEETLWRGWVWLSVSSRLGAAMLGSVTKMGSEPSGVSSSSGAEPSSCRRVNAAQRRVRGLSR